MSVERHCSLESAQKATERIRAAATELWKDVVYAYGARVWIPLGYESWDAYCTAEFGGTLSIGDRSDRMRVVAELYDADMSARAIGSVLDVSKDTVVRDITAGVSERDTCSPDSDDAPPHGIERPTVTGLDGKKYPKPAPAPKVTRNTGDQEWFTPQAYVDAARFAMHGIDLDPASNDIANETVRATRYYTADDDGLVQPWAGRVWMNPPYSSGLIDKFIDRLVTMHRAGHVTAAVVLTNNATETRWWHDLTADASAVCLTLGRIRFVSPTGVKNTPLQGQTFTYLGDDPARFARAFEQFGRVMTP